MLLVDNPIVLSSVIDSLTSQIKRLSEELAIETGRSAALRGELEKLKNSDEQKVEED